MPGAKRECSICQRVMRSDNLKIHEKICKGSKIGSGLLYPTTTSLSRKQRPQFKDALYSTGMESSCNPSNESDESNDSLDEMFGLKQQKDIDTTDHDDDDDEDEENYFWYTVYRACDVKDEEHFLEACAGYLCLYEVKKIFCLKVSWMIQ